MHVKDPWEIFFEEFERKSRHIRLRYRKWDRENEDLEELMRVINQTRQATFDHLRFERHWDVDEARALTNRFAAGILIPWLKDGSGNWNVLKEELRDAWNFPSAGHEPSGGEASLGY